MRRLILLAFALSAMLSASAVPAKRGQWRTLTLTDGSSVRAELRGDEFAHYYMSAEGECYVSAGDGLFQQADETDANSAGKPRRAAIRAKQRSNVKRRVAGADYTFSGEKKGLIILVQFSDLEFESDHDLAFYKRVANEEGFTTSDGFNGSVSDYFHDQSLGKFELTFDVVGPVAMPNGYAYYGADDYSGSDARIGELVAYACQQVDSEVDFSSYDWDGDGEAEEVFVLYAGEGTATSGVDDEIWPHMWYLSSNDYGKSLTLDNTKIDCYACSAEMQSSSKVDGIGTFCHEFSHCMGFPDMYDTNTGDNFGMSVWSLMDYGSYNDDGFTPSGYTAYERWVAGWISPVELKADTVVTGLESIPNGGDAFIIYNDSVNDEVVMFENRRQEGWDAAQYGAGLMAYHIDYDEQSWYYNEVNNDADRQRITIFPADNKLVAYTGYNTVSFTNSLKGDPFPYGTNNAFGSMASTRQSWYNKTKAGTSSIKQSLTDITQNDDGTIDFNFFLVDPAAENYLFYESFDTNDGSGGNDGTNRMSSNVTGSTDNDGWTLSKVYEADQCVKVGSSSSSGSLVSPLVSAEKDCVLTFRAMPFGSDKPALTVTFTDSDTGETTTIATDDLYYDSSSGDSPAWTDYEYTFTSNATGRLTFTATKRFFLDEVKISKPATNGIKAISTAQKQSYDDRVYSIDGRYLGRDINALERGLYIVNGKKVVKR